MKGTSARAPAHERARACRASAAIALVAILAGCLTNGGPVADNITTTSTIPATADPTGGPSSTTPSPTPPPNEPTHPTGSRFANCVGSGPVTFANSPMRAEDVAYLLPYGVLAGGHVTPIDHMYFEPLDRTLGRDVYEVRAIADGVIYQMQPRDAVDGNGAPRGREWHIRFAHSCTFTSYFDLVTSLAPDILAAFNASGQQLPAGGIPVKAGQLIGRIGAQTLDFGVYDYNVTLPGYLVPEHYSEEWKVHTVDPFPYFAPDVRAMLLGKMLRTAEPRAGKIDYDEEGRAIGNWFIQGAGGYGGGQTPNYWRAHFAYVPDALDPTRFFFSVGNWSGDPLQFAVKGNVDPRNITTHSGVVKLEMVTFDWGSRTNATRHGLGGPDGIRPGDDPLGVNGDQVQGAALLQMVGPRLLKLEVFPHKTLQDIYGFDDSARLYER